jgi:hypothetical protein
VGPAAIHVVVAAPPPAPGVHALLRRAVAEAAGRAPVRVLLIGDGLAWADRADMDAWVRTGAAEVSLCSQSVRESAPDRDPGSWPAWVRWSSLVSWLVRTPATDRLWSATS